MQLPGMDIAVGFRLISRGLISLNVSICAARFDDRFCRRDWT